MTLYSKPTSTEDAHREIRKMYREHRREVRRTAWLIRAYGLLIFAINNSRKL